MDLAVLHEADLELRHRLRLVEDVIKLLRFGQHRLDRPAGHFRDVSDLAPERRGAYAEAAEGAAVPLVDEMNVVLVDAEPAGQELARGIDVLAVAPESKLVAVPLGDAAERLHRDNAAAAEVVTVLPHDVGFGKALLDIAMPPGAARCGMMVGVVRRV